MKPQAVSVEGSPKPSGAYSQGVVANGFLFVAGVGPYDPITRAIRGDTVEEQTAQTMKNIRATLLAAGCDFVDIVNSTVYLAELNRDWTAFDATYRTFLEEPYPARAAVGAALKNILVEIAVVAVIPN
jgi:reactive intermediate/imine deaminase